MWIVCICLAIKSSISQLSTIFLILEPHRKLEEGPQSIEKRRGNS